MYIARRIHVTAELRCHRRQHQWFNDRLVGRFGRLMRATKENQASEISLTNFSLYSFILPFFHGCPSFGRHCFAATMPRCLIFVYCHFRHIAARILQSGEIWFPHPTCRPARQRNHRQTKTKQHTRKNCTSNKR